MIELLRPPHAQERPLLRLLLHGSTPCPPLQEEWLARSDQRQS
jgi:hypothetical protein